MVGAVATRDIEDRGVGLEINAAVLRETLSEMLRRAMISKRRDDGVLEPAEILGHGHGNEQAVDAVADAELFSCGSKWMSVA